MKLTNKTAAVLFAAAFASLSAPALADGDYLHYEKTEPATSRTKKPRKLRWQKWAAGRQRMWNLTAAATSPTILM